MSQRGGFKRTLFRILEESESGTQGKDRALQGDLKYLSWEQHIQANRWMRSYLQDKLVSKTDSDDEESHEQSRKLTHVAYQQVVQSSNIQLDVYMFHFNDTRAKERHHFLLATRCWYMYIRTFVLFTLKIILKSETLTWIIRLPLYSYCTL